ncbi:MAG: thermosome subunit beta [Candidatus Bathyarchaeia archaeon]
MSTTIKTNAKPVLIMKEGSGADTVKDSQLNSIAAARAVSEVMKSALGPKGMDKMLVNKFGDIIITNDGRTILQEMELQHPVAKMIVDIARTVDDEVGDGTTSSVVVAGELLGKAEELIKKGIHPTIIVEGFQKAAEKALETLESIAWSVNVEDEGVLKKIAATSMASKIVSSYKEHLSEIIVSAIFSVEKKVDGKCKVDLDDVMIEKKLGESLASTKLINGIVVTKEVVYPAMPKSVEKAKIALIGSALEIKKAQFDSKLVIYDPDQVEELIEQEELIIKGIVDKIAGTGANVIISGEDLDKKAHYFLAKKGILTVRRVKKSTMEKLSKATGGKIITNIDIITEKDLGHADLVEERCMGGDKMVFVEGCKNPHSVAILIRGANQRIVDEAERSIHDALCVVRDVVQEPKIVAGGGAPELEAARAIKKFGITLTGKEQLAALSYADALEVVPRILTENAGLNSIDILPQLRSLHEAGDKWAGMNVLDGKIQDMKQLEVYEPLSVKTQIIKSATEAVSMILSIDEILATGKVKEKPPADKETKEAARQAALNAMF